MSVKTDIQFKDLTDGKIPINAPVRVTLMNNIIEVQYLERMCRQAPVLKLSKDKYMVMIGENSGEIKEYSHTENRSQGYASIKNTFKKMRYLINNNFVGGDNELFITLTYAENMKDTKRLYKDFEKFIKRMKYKYDKENITFDYFSVVEPQGRGAWHVHALFRFDCDKIYIQNKELRELWGQGFVNVHRIKNVDNIGAYLTAYLADYEIQEDSNGTISDPQILEVLQHANIYEEKEVEENGEKKKKKFIKGGRLYMYPSGMNIFRKSKGITYPERIDTHYTEELKKNVLKSAQPQYIKGIELSKYSQETNSDEHFNTLIFESYNLLRSPL